jgi:hypothetical protein
VSSDCYTGYLVTCFLSTEGGGVSSDGYTGYLKLHIFFSAKKQLHGSRLWNLIGRACIQWLLTFL